MIGSVTGPEEVDTSVIITISTIVIIGIILLISSTMSGDEEEYIPEWKKRHIYETRRELEKQYMSARLPIY
jgi:hypothetical protein